MTKFTKILPFFGLCFFLLACTKNNLYPIVPEINYQGVEQIKTPDGKDSVIKIRFSYKDGDGNIGYLDSDSIPPFDFNSKEFHNLFIEVLVKNNNNYEKFAFNPPISSNPSDSFLHFNQRIKSIEPEGRSKSIKGSMEIIQITQFLAFYPNVPNPLVCKLRIQLMDKSLNRSNIVESEEITISF